MSMQFASSLTTAENLSHAVSQICGEIEQTLQGAPDLAFVFASAHWIQEMDAVSEALRSRLAPHTLAGCTGESIVGFETEIEFAPALSVWAAKWDRVRADAFPLHFQRTPDGSGFVGWPDSLLEDWPKDGTLVLLADPFSFPADLLIESLGESHPGTQIIGGMASAASAPGGNRLVLNDHVDASGAVAVFLSGDVVVDYVVSQGCRPVGDTYVVTRAERNVIFELGGKPALEQLRTLMPTLSASDQRRAQQNLHLGRVISEYQDHFDQGDFLIRNVMGIDPDSQGIVVADYMRPGQTVQFHVRDADTSDAELRQLLSAVRPRQAEGGLLFTCNGRGTRLFAEPHHDASVIAEQLGDVPLAGFFAQGEIGPVGGRNFMHGFTASIALFRSPSDG